MGGEVRKLRNAFGIRDLGSGPFLFLLLGLRELDGSQFVFIQFSVVVGVEKFQGRIAFGEGLEQGFFFFGIQDAVGVDVESGATVSASGWAFVLLRF